MVEVVVVIAIIGILASIAVASLADMEKRASFSGVSGDVLTGIRRTQQEASARGTYTAFIVDTTGARWWGIQTTSSFDVTTFDPAAPGTVIVSGSFPTTVTFGPDGYGSTLPAPFNAVPTTTAQSPNSVFCSFCDTGTGFGAVLFEPGEPKVTFSGGPSAAPGQQFTIDWKYKTATSQMVIAIMQRTGLIESFEK